MALGESKINITTFIVTISDGSLYTKEPKFKLDLEGQEVALGWQGTSTAPQGNGAGAEAESESKQRLGR